MLLIGHLTLETNMHFGTDHMSLNCDSTSQIRHYTPHNAIPMKIKILPWRIVQDWMRQYAQSIPGKFWKAVVQKSWIPWRLKPIFLLCINSPHWNLQAHVQTLVWQPFTYPAPTNSCLWPILCMKFNLHWKRIDLTLSLGHTGRKFQQSDALTMVYKKQRMWFLALPTLLPGIFAQCGMVWPKGLCWSPLTSWFRQGFLLSKFKPSAIWKYMLWEHKIFRDSLSTRLFHQVYFQNNLSPWATPIAIL